MNVCHLVPFLFFIHLPTNTHTRLTAFFPGLPRWASARKVRPIWILLKQETVSLSGISWAICKLQVCTLLQTDNHANSSPFCFLQAGCPSCHPTNSIKTLKATKIFKLSPGHSQTTWPFPERSQIGANSCCLLPTCSTFTEFATVLVAGQKQDLFSMKPRVSQWTVLFGYLNKYYMLFQHGCWENTLTGHWYTVFLQCLSSHCEKKRHFQ